MAETEQQIYSVTELTKAIKGVLESQFSEVWIEGEISNLATPRSGHVYFTLKDEQSQIRGVMFKYVGSRLKFQLEHGMRVLLRGSLSVYAPRGEYQVIATYLEPRGTGALQLAFEQLKERLAREGLFEQTAKQPIPLLPRKIGIVTSATGAAIRDILQVVQRRFANVHIIVVPVRVQGTEAPGEIVNAIKMLNTLSDIDVMIVGRGGGSLEDLWAFNEEIVARAIFASRIPVISAVGHEIDFTIADFVADLRAPTPSAAAELVVQHKETLAHTVEVLTSRLTHTMLTTLSSRQESVRHARTRLPDPGKKLHELQQRIDDLRHRLHTTMQYRLDKKRAHFGTVTAKLESASPLALLSRGYAICRHAATRRTITSAADVIIGEDVLVRVSEGEFRCEVKATLER